MVSNISGNVDVTTSSATAGLSRGNSFVTVEGPDTVTPRIRGTGRSDIDRQRISTRALDMHGVGLSEHLGRLIDVFELGDEVRVQG